MANIAIGPSRSHVPKKAALGIIAIALNKDGGDEYV